MFVTCTRAPRQNQPWLEWSPGGKHCDSHSCNTPTRSPPKDHLYAGSPPYIWHGPNGWQYGCERRTDVCVNKQQQITWRRNFSKKCSLPCVPNVHSHYKLHRWQCSLSFIVYLNLANMLYKIEENTNARRLINSKMSQICNSLAIGQILAMDKHVTMYVLLQLLLVALTILVVFFNSALELPFNT